METYDMWNNIAYTLDRVEVEVDEEQADTFAGLANLALYKDSETSMDHQLERRAKLNSWENYTMLESQIFYLGGSGALVLFFVSICYVDHSQRINNLDSKVA